MYRVRFSVILHVMLRAMFQNLLRLMLKVSFAGDIANEVACEIVRVAACDVASDVACEFAYDIACVVGCDVCDVAFDVACGVVCDNEVNVSARSFLPRSSPKGFFNHGLFPSGLFQKPTDGNFRGYLFSSQGKRSERRAYSQH